MMQFRIRDLISGCQQKRTYAPLTMLVISKDFPFETLEVDAKVALEIFQRKYKIDFIVEKVSQHPKRTIKLYRFGDFIDVSEGSLIPRTSICFQNVSSHPVESCTKIPGSLFPCSLKSAVYNMG